MSRQANSSNPTQSAESSQSLATSSPTHHAGAATPAESSRDYLRVPAPLHADSGYNTDANDNESNADDAGEVPPPGTEGDDERDTEMVVEELLVRWTEPEIGGEEESTGSTNGDEGQDASTQQVTTPGSPSDAASMQSRDQPETANRATVARAPPSDASRGGSASA